MKQLEYRFWKVAPAGEVFAVQVDALQGDVIGVCGPLHHSDVASEKLQEFDYRTDDVEWMEELYTEGRTSEITSL